MRTSTLHTLADAAGVATRWTDAFGQPQSVGDDAIRALLAALGLPAGTAEETEHSLATLEGMDPATQAPLPLHTVWAGEAAVLPGGAFLPGAAYRITPEASIGGAADPVDGRFQAGPGGQVLTEALQLPAGYHALTSGDLQTTLAVAPRRCFGVADASAAQASRPGSDSSDGDPHRDTARPWGIAAQLYSLRRDGDGGLGDYSALESLARAAAAQGASALAISPVHAMFSAEPGCFSPYGPSSRLFFNAFHIDPARVLGEEALLAALQELPGSEASMAALDGPALVDWPRAGALRLAVLRRLFERFSGRANGGAATPAQRQALTDFIAAGGTALRDHARYEAIDANLCSAGESNENGGGGGGGDWRRWPAALHDPHGAAVQAFAEVHAEEVDFHLFLQWQASLGRARAQAAAREAGMAIGLVADLAVGADPGGSQAWGLQSAMLAGVTVGAPPDLLAPQGQNWGLGALSPRAMQQQGFAPWLAMLRANMRDSGGIRIDHVLGLMRLWLVPEGRPASDGAYVRFPFDDMLRLVALESWRHRAIVIGEDLGTVPDGFSQTLDDAGILGIRVLWFEREWHDHRERFKAPQRYPAGAMATTSTHDLATIAGWWQGRDIDWRERLDLLGPEADAAAGQRRARVADRRELLAAFEDAGIDHSAGTASDADGPPLDAAITYIGQTPAALVMVPLEDVLGLVEQPNLPGTTAVHPNWQQRLPGDAAGLLQAHAVQQRLAALRAARGTPLQTDPDDHGPTAIHQARP